MTKADLFRTAHEMAKELKANSGMDYRTCFSISLKKAWTMMKANETIESKLVSMGFKVWEKYGKRRIYVNIEDFEKVTDFGCNERGQFTYRGYRLSPNLMKSLSRIRLYFDCDAQRWEASNWEEAELRWQYATVACSEYTEDGYSLGDSILDMIKSEFAA